MSLQDKINYFLYLFYILDGWHYFNVLDLRMDFMSETSSDNHDAALWWFFQTNIYVQYRTLHSAQVLVGIQMNE